MDSVTIYIFVDDIVVVYNNYLTSFINLALFKSLHWTEYLQIATGELTSVKLCVVKVNCKNCNVLKW